MKVKCIDNFNEKLDLTVGQEYDVYSTGEIKGKTVSYTVKNDSGLLCAYGIILFELVEETKLQCENGCIHAQICGHKTEWANYRKEHIKLREKSVLFDEEPKCRYYIHKSRLKEEEPTTKVDKDDLVEKIKRSNIIKKENSEGRKPYKDDYAWHFDNDKRKAYEYLKPHKKDGANHIRDDENVKVRKLTDEELIKVVEKFLGL